MGLFSRKKPQPQQPLPPVPRFPVPSGQLAPRYEPEFQQEPRLPEFPDLSHEPVTIPPPPEQPSFPRPAEEPRPLPQAAVRLEPVRVSLPPQPTARPQPVEIPVREPAFLRRPLQYPTREAVARDQAFPWQRVEQPAVSRPIIPDHPLPPVMPPQPVQRAPVSFSPPVREPGTMSVEDKPLFIKIGQYREAMSHLELLKQKVKEAEAALARLEDLRNKEATEITNAHTMLATVKDKLLAIDKKLFEV